MIVHVKPLGVLFVSTTEAPSPLNRSMSASRSSLRKSRWMGYEAGCDFSRRWNRNRGRLDSLAEALLEHETLDEADVYSAAGVPHEAPSAASDFAAAARSTTPGE